MNAATLAVALFVAPAAVLAAGASPPGVTPSGDSVPENLLRIELHFARPLRHALAMDRVRLVDASGATIPDAFLDLPLPGDDGRSVTLLLHPGRVKTGVGANLALGRALRAGEDVALVVDDPQLPHPLRQRWHVMPALEAGVFDGAWRVDAPRAGTRGPVRVTLATALTASSAALIAVRDPQGGRLAGAVSLRDGETVWEFRPVTAWRAGRYAIVVHPRLEDVAGNRPCAPFEARDLARTECPQMEHAFDVRR